MVFLHTGKITSSDVNVHVLSQFQILKHNAISATYTFKDVLLCFEAWRILLPNMFITQVYTTSAHETQKIAIKDGYTVEGVASNLR